MLEGIVLKRGMQCCKERYMNIPIFITGISSIMYGSGCVVSIILLRKNKERVPKFLYVVSIVNLILGPIFILGSIFDPVYRK